jgi:pSer/pThr/pTyr-binding forkhead associated (FHA) protein
MAPATQPQAAAPMAVAAPQNWQLVHAKPEVNEKHLLQGESVMVGRDHTCAIVLTHPAVSRRHARITLSNGAYLLEDLKSANGTYVNNARVERVVLKAGDVVRFGADPACSYVVRSQ